MNFDSDETLRDAHVPIPEPTTTADLARAVEAVHEGGCNERCRDGGHWLEPDPAQRPTRADDPTGGA